METIAIKYKIPLDKWAKMKECDISRIVALYSGCLYDATCDGNCVELIIVAPSTWKYNLLQNCLGVYRYC